MSVMLAIMLVSSPAGAALWSHRTLEYESQDHFRRLVPLPKWCAICTAPNRSQSYSERQLHEAALDRLSPVANLRKFFC